jgi:hypothetical protein
VLALGLWSGLGRRGDRRAGTVESGGGNRRSGDSDAVGPGRDQEEAREVAVVAYGGGGALTQPVVARTRKLLRRRPR